LITVWYKLLSLKNDLININSNVLVSSSVVDVDNWYSSKNRILINDSCVVRCVDSKFNNDVKISSVVPYNVRQIRSFYNCGLIDVDVSNGLIDCWRERRSNIILSVENRGNVSYFGFMASKRGNDVYRHRVYSKHKELFDFCDNNKIDYVYSRDGKYYSKILKLTNTVDINRYDLNDFNKNVCSREYDLFIKRLKIIDSKVVVARSYEVFFDKAKGYLHINVIAKFNKEFEVFFHKSKKSFHVDGSPVYTYRLRSYSDKQKLGKLWRCGHVDIRAVSDTNDLIEYCLKYHIKHFTNPYNQKQQRFTLSTLTLFNKRGFSIPQKFTDVIVNYSPVGTESFEVRLDKYMHNSRSCELSDDLCEISFKFLGIIEGYDEQDWFFNLDEPPPEFDNYNFILNNSYDLVETKIIPELRADDDGFRFENMFKYPIEKLTSQKRFVKGFRKNKPRKKRSKVLKFKLVDNMTLGGAIMSDG
jgi:hypothetical protein